VTSCRALLAVWRAARPSDRLSDVDGHRRTMAYGLVRQRSLSLDDGLHPFHVEVRFG
jgi:hypothetical protein